MIINQKKAGVIISYLGIFVHLLTVLIYTPIMLRLLGQSEYGLYQLVYSVISYLGLFSFGFGASYMRFYAREKQCGTTDSIANLNGMYMSIFLGLALISVLCGLVLLTNIRYVFKAGLTENEYSTARKLMGIMIINIALTFPNSVFNCIITSQEKFIFQKTLILLQYILNPILSLPLLLMGYKSIAMVCVSFFLNLTVLASNSFYCFHVLHVRIKFSKIRFPLLGEMGVFTLFIFVNEITDLINWSVDKYLLGRFVGTISVAVYSIGSQINTLYLQLSTSISNVFVPRINHIIAKEDDSEEITRIFIKVGRVQFMVLMMVATVFFFFGKAFIYHWAGNGYDHSYYVTLFLIGPVTIPLIQNIGIEIQRAKNKHKARSIVYFLIAICNIVISIPLIRLFGEIGAAIGTAISLLIGNGLFMNWYYHKQLNIDILLFWKNILQIVPSLIVPSIVGLFSMYYFEFESVITLMIAIMIYCIIYSICIFFGAMHKEERKWISAPIRKYLSIKS